jgi:hypothetical protein
MWGALTGTVAPIFRNLGSPVVITSGSETHDLEGKAVTHSATSLHWSGNAADVRIWYLTDDQEEIAHRALSLALGPHFDVVLEEHHFHIEYQPKRAIVLG